MAVIEVTWGKTSIQKKQTAKACTDSRIHFWTKQTKKKNPNNCKGSNRFQNTFWKPSTIKSRQKTCYLTFINHKRLLTGSFYLEHLTDLFSFAFNKRSSNRLQQTDNTISSSLQNTETIHPADSSVTVSHYFKAVQDAQNFWLQVLSKRPSSSSSPLP